MTATAIAEGSRAPSIRTNALGGLDVRDFEFDAGDGYEYGLWVSLDRFGNVRGYILRPRHGEVREQAR